MIIYSSTKQAFIQDFEQGVLVKKLHQTLTEKYRRVGESEIHSWQTSLSYMANVMRDIAIPVLPLNISFRIPKSVSILLLPALIRIIKNTLLSLN